MCIASDEDKNSYMIGQWEMTDKASKTCLETLKEIPEDISSADLTHNSGYHILSLIRDTMSDRAATEKSFNVMLEEYRQDLLPSILTNWYQMTTEDQ